MDDGEQRHGAAYGLVAYGIWGAFPLYFAALRPAGAWEILSHRILWTAVLCTLVLVVRKDLRWARQLWQRPRLGLGVTAAALLIAANWVVYVAAVLGGHTTEAALGYFLNPIVTVALGVLVLGERLRPLQWLAVAIGALAAVYLSVAAGAVPLIAVSLACSFGGYGLVKKKIGVTLAALHSLAAETLVLTPVAVVLLSVLTLRGTTTFTGDGGWHTALLLLAGIFTAAPLLLFAAAARRVPLVTVGLLQFVTPVLQLLCGVLLLHEHLSAQRWVGFAIVWVALAVLSVDSLRSYTRRAPRELHDPRQSPEPAQAPDRLAT
ncbi:EamA family transporter RarD [Pedococcus sp. 5OH_020]|uniref:EamA family transporter RarD n=1 Tax=Pedococcus sp. 5OH_020 TaxID=2989814 RepID=UPI0022E9AD2B|nr:EamA family transporter RarD [Pedococcus sp. 5OH_020]